MKIVEKRHPIFELQKKFAFLRENPIAQDICGHSGSENSFADKLGIPRKTLLDGVESGKLSSTVQSALATKCKFSRDWPEWIDPKARPANRRDTADEFTDKSLEKHARNENDTIAVRQLSTIAAHRAELPRSINEKLASLTLSADQRGPGEVQPIGVELACIPEFLEIAELTVRRGQLRISCGGRELGNADERRKFLASAEFMRNPNNVEIALFGGPLQPAWEISLDEPPREGWYITGNVCQVRDLAVGSVLMASFEVYRKDLKALRHSAGPDKSAATQHKSRALRFTDFQELSEAKAAILALLATCAVGGDSDYVILCQDSLEFRDVAVPRDGQTDE